MRIGFLISGVGMFGSVREIVENGNHFIESGHEVFIFNPTGEKISWLDFKGKSVIQSEILKYKLDVLILTTTPTNEYYELFKTCEAKIRVFCFMGFDPHPEMNTFAGSNLKEIINNYYLIADSQWQIDFLKRETKSSKIIDAQLGGINLKMFVPLKKEKKDFVVGWSGDRRRKKDGIILESTLKSLPYKLDSYFGKEIKQKDMSEWFSGIDVFVDNHFRGGWCNPVAEAMACRVPVVCSITECNSQFANHETAYMFDQGNMEQMKAGVEALRLNIPLREKIAINGYLKIQEFDYNITAKNVLRNLLILNDSK